MPHSTRVASTSVSDGQAVICSTSTTIGVSIFSSRNAPQIAEAAQARSTGGGRFAARCGVGGAGKCSVSTVTVNSPQCSRAAAESDAARSITQRSVPVSPFTLLALPSTTPKSMPAWYWKV